MKLSESNLEFDFADTFIAIKFDDTDFYRKIFQKLPNGKGVDFLAVSEKEKTMLFIEVKNFTGNESDNRYRIAPDNKKVITSTTTINTENRESLDIEISKKIAMTLACLVGIHTKPDFKDSDELKLYSSYLMSPAIAQGEKNIKIVLFLEGNLGTITHPMPIYLKMLADSIKKKLSWLNCQIFVENSVTQKKRFFTVTA